MKAGGLSKHRVVISVDQVEKLNAVGGCPEWGKQNVLNAQLVLPKVALPDVLGDVGCGDLDGGAPVDF
eukprot:15499706-Heterocapsa_arctica.AAC.1